MTILNKKPIVNVREGSQNKKKRESMVFDHTALTPDLYRFPLLLLLLLPQVANYPDLELGEENKIYKKALELAEKNGTLERLSGKGYRYHLWHFQYFV